MMNKLEDPGHVVAQRYLEQRGFKYWEFMQQMGETVRVISHRQCLELCKLEPNWAKDGIYYLWFEYPETGGYGSGRCLNPTRRMGKMLCPKNVPPPLYIPPNIQPQETIYFCESALKAIKMVENGFCAVAGNGVDGIFTHRGLAENFPDAMLDNAKTATVLFDSDIEHNKNVSLAAQKLALAITTQWPHLQIVGKHLPPPDLGDEEHWGLDDYCAYHGDAAFVEWVNGEDGSHPFDLGQRGRHLLELAAQYAICKSPVGIVHFDSGNVYKTSDFKGTLEANRKFYYVNPDTGNSKRACGANEYLEWRDRNEVEECRYHPGRDTGFQGDMYNKWRDDGAKPVEGSVQPFIDMVMNAIPRNEDAWLMLRMFAWGLQNRGRRWEKALMLISVQQSTGKSTIADIIGRCYGRSNMASIAADEFGGAFNGMYMERELLKLDEVMKLKPGEYAKIERLVTDDYVDVNVKFGGQYMTDNYLNIVMTSNKPDCITLKDAERRLFALEVTPTEYHPQGSVYWTEFYSWLDDGGGIGAVREWLEGMDLSGFDPKFLPPVNPMKIAMLDSGRSEMDNWVLELKHNPHDVMGSARLYYTPEEIALCYLRDTGGLILSEGHQKGIKSKLIQSLGGVAGFKKAHGGTAVTFSTGGKKHKLRFWNISGPADHIGADIRADYETDPLYSARFAPINDGI